ncbi:acetyl-CoA acetyltransferase [Rhodococcus sp. 06-156-3C]|uniref:thiolase family protein n=1 Tax=Nocardiaceae TaxID=85025 RepID=UPI000522FCC3|nr:MULTISPECIES: thiolase family protein [Rhodococcus]OZD13076.1 acetyl-CoA acetyltransferase [Rhodococcus sp. 06-156-4a]OZD17945.1 acetyl-CoA acetyltransferase [Rhodococcus sp. 06-156-3C]OZD20669.1 acetyl-CoA acetyltransferase [Rhodococcus sp. 06-156-4C]OZD30613.1 acetyl-CoA acetyltransferase [Rhodococcus sp. 06-156-3b]OZD32615.1 acetyl-CoA acetyltransferase [Rhodococcus sp. 06-156-3]
MRGKSVIAGIGNTAFGKLPGRSTVSMNIEACRNALADAGIEKDMVDGLFVKCPTSLIESFYGQKLAEAMGIMPRVGGVWDQGGAANGSMIGMAAMAIDAGQCDVALVCFADNPRSGTPQAYRKPKGINGLYGWFGVPSGYAMIAQRHMAEYGTTSEQLGAIAVAMRKHGAANPRAQLRKPITIDDHQAARWIVEPLHRDDCCLISDGGAAVVVMSAERAKSLGIDDAVSILGFGQGQTSWEVEQRPVLTSTAAKQSAETAFAMSGLKPSDIDVAQLYDCFTITVLTMLEDYGFCKPGEGGKFVEQGALEVGGVLPTNTSGGLLSETGMPGMQLVLEAVRQLRGESTSQVNGAEKAIVGTQGGTMTTHSTLILGR